MGHDEPVWQEYSTSLDFCYKDEKLYSWRKAYNDTKNFTDGKDRPNSTVSED